MTPELVQNIRELAWDLPDLASLPALFATQFLRISTNLVTENLFVRRQLRLFLKPEARPHRAANRTSQQALQLERRPRHRQT